LPRDLRRRLCSLALLRRFIQSEGISAAKWLAKPVDEPDGIQPACAAE